MYTQNTLLKNNRFNTIHRVIDSYPEYDFKTDQMFTVIVLEDEQGESMGIAKNYVELEYTILEDNKDNQIKSLIMEYNSYRKKFSDLESKSLKMLEETGEHDLHSNFENMFIWECELLNKADYLGVTLF